MLENLRWRLTVWFIGLSVLLYGALSVAAVVVFDSGLNSVVDQELGGLSREIRPAIEFVNGRPTLRSWAENAKRQDDRLLATVQLFDREQTVLEQYGPTGLARLISGTVTQGNSVAPPVRSRYSELRIGAEVVGYLQTQINTKARDNAIRQLIWTLLILAPFLLVGLGLCGYLFAGTAIKPTEESLGMLRRFVADAGHELNTPITIIQASVETLERKLENAENIANLLSMIKRASDRLANLGMDLMLLAKLENPQQLAALEVVQLDQLVKTIAQDMLPAFQAKEIELRCKLNTPIELLAHAESMRAMISNLVDNSLHYTPAGTVTLTLEERNGLALFTVEDTGQGIPHESLSRIFERFYRVDKSRSRNVGGAGLGLAIVKAIVDAHKGVVRVESTVGKGTRFAIQLPIRSINASTSKTNVT